MRARMASVISIYIVIVTVLLSLFIADYILAIKKLRSVCLYRL